MSISRLRCIARPFAWSRIAPYATYSTAIFEIVNSVLQPHPQPQPGQKSRPTRNQAASSSTLNSIPNKPTMMEGIPNVAQPPPAVSIINDFIPGSRANLEARHKAFGQSTSQLPKKDNNMKMPTAKPKSSRRNGRDEKVDPSAASGGVPDATQEYLRDCLFGPKPLPQPQHLLVVIDLNGTLLYRPNRKNPTTFHMRPHAQTFLKYCVETFTVVIWSSAKAANVKAMCETILTPDIKNRVAAIWGRDKFGLCRKDFELRVQCYKRLTQIWQDPEIAFSHPAYHEGFRWNQTNTVLIDDSREKARTEPHNLIEVPEYFGDVRERDDILPQVHDYLNHLSMHSNVIHITLLGGLDEDQMSEKVLPVADSY